jgi:septal ring-binding cell division protein DamX
MKKIYSLSKIALSLALTFTLQACAHSAKSPTYSPLSNAVSETACQNNAYLKQYNCSLENVEQAAQLNEPDAEYALGYMYYNGIGTVKDTQTAIVWISRAAEQGQPLAISALKTIRHAQFPTMGQVTVASDKPVPQTTPLQAPSKSKQTSHATVVTSKPMIPMSKIQSMPSNHFTAQLFASPHLQTVHQLAESLPHHVPMTIASIEKQGVTWYLLLAGDFVTHQDAAAYVATLPASVKNAGPWIRSFESLKK